MNHTTNYNLPQWEATDAVKREDVNGAMATVDAALKTVSDAAANVPEFVFGTYTGDGQESQTIYLGRRPKAVLVEPIDGIRNQANGGIAAYGYPATYTYNSYSYRTVEVTVNGFRVRYSMYSTSVAAATNISGNIYYYIAIF